MATTTTENGRFIEIIWDAGITDWVFEDEVNKDFVKLEKVKVKSITFHPSGADTFHVREGSLTGATIMIVKTTDAADQRVKYFGDEGTWMKPYIEADDLSFSTLADVRVIIELA